MLAKNRIECFGLIDERYLRVAICFGTGFHACVNGLLELSFAVHRRKVLQLSISLRRLEPSNREIGR